jgi:hypothetical protein
VLPAVSDYSCIIDDAEPKANEPPATDERLVQRAASASQAASTSSAPLRYSDTELESAEHVTERGLPARVN